MTSNKILILLVLAISGCQTSSIDDFGVGTPQPLTTPAPTATDQAVPADQTNAAPQTASIPTLADEGENQAKNTGTFPTIGNTPVGETEQLTKSKTAAIRNELLAAGKKNSEAGAEEELSQYQKELLELRKKAITHGKEAIKKIESPQG